MVATHLSRTSPLLLMTLVFGCGPEDEKEEPEPEVEYCAELPEGAYVLQSSLEPDEPAITIAVAEVSSSECGAATHWNGTLLLPADIAPGTHTLSEDPPSLYLYEYTIPSCMGSQSFGLNQYATGTVTISSVAAGCVAGEINAASFSDGGGDTPHKGAFAAEPPM